MGILTKHPDQAAAPNGHSRPLDLHERKDQPTPARHETLQDPRALRETLSDSPVIERAPGSQSIETSIVIIPLLPDGRPDVAHRVVGSCVHLGVNSVILECPRADQTQSPSIIVGVQLDDGSMRYAGLQVQQSRLLDQDRLWLAGSFDGPAHQFLQSANLSWQFRPDSLSFERPLPEETLREWADLGVLRRVSGDRIQVCPRCQALPTFRPGCHNCGSARISQDSLIHHFACAYVAPATDFESAAGGLVCPKCRLHIVVGADFEYQTGLYRCQDCAWSDAEPERVAQCLSCGLRFPEHQAELLDLPEYDADRLDPLAFAEAS